MPDLSDVYAHAAEVTASVADREAVLMLPAKGQIKVLNEVGTCVWELIDGERQLAGIVAEVCRIYDVKAKQAEADTLAFVQELDHKGLIQRCGQPVDQHAGGGAARDAAAE